MKKTPHFIYTSQQPLAWAHHPSEWHPHHPFNYTHAHANTQSERVTLSWIYMVTVYLLGAGGMGEVELFFAAKLLLSVFNTVCVCAKARVCVFAQCELGMPCTVEQSVRLLLFSWQRSSGFSWVNWCWCRCCGPSCCSCCRRPWRSKASFVKYVYLYIHIYLEIMFCFSSSFRDWTLQHFQKH